MSDLLQPAGRRAAKRRVIGAAGGIQDRLVDVVQAARSEAAGVHEKIGVRNAPSSKRPTAAAKPKPTSRVRALAKRKVAATRKAEKSKRAAAAAHKTLARLDKDEAIHAKASAKRERRDVRTQSRTAARRERRKGADDGHAGPLGLIDALGFFFLAAVIVFKGVEEHRGAGGWRGWLASISVHDGRSAEAEALEPGRGRAARGPHEIPARGWRDILSRTWTEFNQDQVMTVAGGVTFFTLLALFPAMAAFVSLYGLFFDVNTALSQLSSLAGVLPRDTLTFIAGEMQRLAQARSGGLSLAFVLGLLISVWSANGAVKAVFYGLNIAYEEHERRSFLKLNLMSLAFTLGALAFVIVAFAAVVAAPVILGFVGLSGFSVVLAELRWPALLVVTIVGLSVLYRYGPSRATPKWRWITPGSLFAAVMWLVASLAFSVYVSNFGHFNKTYGSLGAVIGFMTWIWYSTTIVLFGAELNAELEHQTSIDTTTGSPITMGTRGAHVADTLGPIRGARPAPKPLGA